MSAHGNCSLEDCFLMSPLVQLYYVAFVPVALSGQGEGEKEFWVPKTEEGEVRLEERAEAQIEPKSCIPSHLAVR